MSYYFSSASEQSTSASAGVDLFLANIHAIAGLRAYVRKLQAAPNANAVDVQVRLRLQRSTTLATAGGAFTPEPVQTDGPAAQAVVTTLPTAGAFATSRIPVQVTFNSRGTGLWAAFVEDEAVSILGATAPNSELVLRSQQSGSVAVPVDFKIIHSE